ncbi:50S ribosomal protein L18 [Candidatus Nitronereus thalassa]|uniref:Large ribosomal subunit protein uL18 n=1 Tax=Candidatus Nitronereus thalassa TaxID=3020898 RepID=A0ABU3KBM7_9BACT|nr:50S ribosomal protein L18 [Candidatus Nitronereus thalassa]MDT7043841.1 50S ribosomal protein L18 [Candidatus Nitronereus thalassa]
MNEATKRRRFSRRKARVRKKILGSDARPRLNVFRSNAHIYAQIIDDIQGRTLAAASSLEKAIQDSVSSGASTAAAKAVGQRIAERAKAANVTAVVFDRGGRLFHGRVKALADASREAGLNF